MQLFKNLQPIVSDASSALPQIWELLGRAEPKACAQALALLDALDDESVWRAIARGTKIDAGSERHSAHSAIAKHVHPEHQLLVAVHALGALDALPAEVDLINLDTDNLNFMRRAGSVRALDLGRCRFADVSGLAGSKLVKLSSSLSTGVTGLEILGALGELEELHLTAPGLADLSWITGLRKLRKLSLYHSKVKDLRPLADLQALESVCIHGKVRDLTPLARLPRLQELSLPGNPVRDLSPIAKLDLHTLDISKTRVVDLAPIAGCVNLRWLDADETAISSLVPLRALTEITRLDIKKCPSLNCLDGIEPLTKLRALGLQDAPLVVDLSPLTGLSALESLSIERCPAVADFGVLAAVVSLTRLSIAHCPQLADIAWIGALSGLKSLAVTNCPAVTDVRWLARLGKLWALSLEGMSGVHDITPLLDLPITSLQLGGCPGAGRFPEHLFDVKVKAFFARYRAKQAAGTTHAALDAAQRRHLAAIRKGLGSREWATVLQAIQLAWDLQDPAVWAVVSLGLVVEDGAGRATGGEVQKRVWHAFRPAATLYVLALDGRLAPAKELRVEGVPVDFTPALSGLSELRKLTLTRTAELTSLAALTGLDALEELNLAYCCSLSDISAVATMPRLRALNLCGTGVVDLTPVAALPTLERLECPDNRALTDLRPLAHHPSLRSLIIWGTGVTDYTPLYELHGLKELRTSTLPPAVRQKLQRALPGCAIS